MNNFHRYNIVFIKYIYLLIVLTTGTGCFSEEKKAETHIMGECVDLVEQITGTTPLEWLNAHKEQLKEYKEREVLMPNYYYELGPLTLPLAVKELKSTSIKELSFKEAKYYNQHFQQEKGMKPYLVRAVFSGYTGGLFIVKSGETLRIISSSLGSGGSPLFTPLIINLSKKPKNLVLKLNSAL